MKFYILILAAVFSFTSLSFANPVDQLPPAVAKKHLAITDSQCSSDLTENVETYDLGQGHSLYLVPCYLGAYQGSWNAYIAKGEQVDPVIVLSYDETVKAVTGTFLLTEPAYDAKTNTLTTFGKGRGLGDCGQSSVTKVILSSYGYVSIKTTEIRAKIECDGKYNSWPIVFKQK